MLRVYHKHKAGFQAVIARGKANALLCAAGVKAKASYESAHGAAPPMAGEHGRSVCCYPESFEPVILECLGGAARGLAGQARGITAYMPVVVSMPM